MLHLQISGLDHVLQFWELLLSKWIFRCSLFFLFLFLFLWGFFVYLFIYCRLCIFDLCLHKGTHIHLHGSFLSKYTFLYLTAVCHALCFLSTSVHYWNTLTSSRESLGGRFCHSVGGLQYHSPTWGKQKPNIPSQNWLKQGSACVDPQPDGLDNIHVNLCTQSWHTFF